MQTPPSTTQGERHTIAASEPSEPRTNASLLLRRTLGPRSVGAPPSGAGLPRPGPGLRVEVRGGLSLAVAPGHRGRARGPRRAGPTLEWGILRSAHANESDGIMERARGSSFVQSCLNYEQYYGWRCSRRQSRHPATTVS